MSVILRPGAPADAEACGAIAFEAFRSICAEHNFPLDFPSVAAATDLVTMKLSNPRIYSVVAESDGKVIGSNFLDERNQIAGIGPVSVDPAAQNQGVGQQLMLSTLDRASERGFPGVRLVQAAYHNRSLCLYAKLGFEVRETVSKFDGVPLGVSSPGYHVRKALRADLACCNALCRAVHGHDRAGELVDAVSAGTARVVEHLGTIIGYCTNIAFFGHAIGENNYALKALIGAATGFAGGGFLVPTRNSDLFRWCLQQRLRLIH